ncbi:MULTISPECIES: TetR/AcrR family transcriptional regulator [Myxococcus]|uniref:TetR family transcriptional regulator n=1 Tax=Myxococcus xanthus TaxID=34 RepID=A0AAE6FXW3_MYXXA|nr:MULTISPECIES: TetR/AcrR family transcriptional regulator [Myxococcus]QDE67385.1 TetR family transcriptional regulator [Myxococcus xanthus]QDE74661.1 TetR family transcriptional regulator [Myxococcus xanthus]QDE81940.1 TetR family transcriptional regulator [Myxococcus xanthus]QDE96245.1 TetR family transcriptional regulator [Myxococcus xanthus]QDF03699.1 TetR family transcriptional regulator [Myxococcus xanthus]
MPQVLKEEIRERILTAALEVFATHGYAVATMSDIASRAGLGTASMYRYYGSKEALFAAVVTPALAERFEALLEERVRALAHMALSEPPGQVHERGEEMLRFWVENRLAVVVLLDRAAGTPYAHYGERFVELLVSTTLAQLRTSTPGLRVSPTARFVLTRIFENTRRMLAAILTEHARERALREAIEAFWSYQIPGLRGFAAWMTTQS